MLALLIPGVGMGGGSNGILALTMATETDTAIAITANKAKALGTATETDSSQTFGINKARLLGISLEFDLALGLTGGQSQTPSSGIPILQISKFLRK